MPLTASLKAVIDGAGQIPGSQVIEDRKGEIPVFAARQQIKTGISPLTGMPTDDRTHSTFTITKRIDQSTPFLQQAMRDNLPFSTWHLRFFHMPFSGTEFNYATATLKNARIVSISMNMPHVAKPGNSQIPETEDVEFQYDSLGWSFGKHQSDPSPGSNAKESNETGCQPATDWFEQEAKALLLGLPKLIWDAKKVLWKEWEKNNPGKKAPDEFQDTPK
jgi:type VI secretion system Hcp family effector